MTKIQTQGVHHITFVGSNREAIIDFYQGVLGMPLVFEQPNLDVPEEMHLYFDPGDGRLITFFVRPTRVNDPTPNPQNTGNIDRGFMDSIYFRDPNGQLLEMACFKFIPPEGHTYADVLSIAHRMRVEAGEYAIADKHLSDAISELIGQKIKIPS
jgi:glyoxalase family protein